MEIDPENVRRMPGGSLLLNLPRQAWRVHPAERVDLALGRMPVKDELHITLFNADVMAALVAKLGEDAVLARARSQAWRPERCGDGALIHDEEGDAARTSLVEWLRLDGFDELRAGLARSAGIDIPRTRPHITQYSSDPRGIGLADMETIRRRQLASFRWPGIAPRLPRTDADEVRRGYEDGCTLLPPDVAVEIGRREVRIDDWLQAHDASAAFILTVADPLGEPACKAGNGVRWALLDDELRRAGLRGIEVPGREDDDEPMRLSLCVPHVDETTIDRLLRDYEQLAAVRLARGCAPALYLHPALREAGDEGGQG